MVLRNLVTVHEVMIGQTGNLHHKGFPPFGLCQNREGVAIIPGVAVITLNGSKSRRLVPAQRGTFTVRSTADKAGGYVPSPCTAMWPGKIATPNRDNSSLPT